MVKKYGELLRETKRTLREAGWPDAENAARELLAYASGKSQAALLADRELYASEEAGSRLAEYTERMMLFTGSAVLDWVVTIVIVLTTVYSGVEYFVKNWDCLNLKKKA